VAILVLRATTALEAASPLSFVGGAIPMAKRADMVKVELRDEHNNVETLWATPLGRRRYRLENSPFFAYGVSWLDVVEARPPVKGEIPAFVRVVKKSGHRTIRIIFKPPVNKSRKSKAVLETLVTMGCSYEGANSAYIAVDIPPGVDLSAVCECVTSTGLEWEHGDPRYAEMYPNA
jgi:hypothetical protein